MQTVRFSADHALPIELFHSVGASSVALGHGHGETHVYAIHVEAGGMIGTHPTGFAQLFLVVQGSGWASGHDNIRQPLKAGEGVYFACGEMHAKGSDEGMMAIMIQVSDMNAE